MKKNCRRKSKLEKDVASFKNQELSGYTYGASVVL